MKKARFSDKFLSTRRAYNEVNRIKRKRMGRKRKFFRQGKGTTIKVNDSGFSLFSLPERSHTIHLKNNLDATKDPKAWFDFFIQLSNPKFNRFYLNFRQLDFIFPETIVHLAAICNGLLKNSQVKVIEKRPDSKELEKYLEIAGLRDYFYLKKKDNLNNVPTLRDHCMPISREKGDKTGLARKIVEIFKQEVELDVDKTDLMTNSISEIFGNVLDHVETDFLDWYRIAQLHPTRQLLTIAISDLGIGIPTSLRNGHNGHSYKEFNDADLIEESLKLGVTKHQNEEGVTHGQGLDTVNDFARTYNASLTIVSNTGYLNIDYKESTREQVSKYNHTREIPGTMILLRIPLNGE